MQKKLDRRRHQRNKKLDRFPPVYRPDLWFYYFKGWKRVAFIGLICFVWIVVGLALDPSPDNVFQRTAKRMNRLNSL